ncbi:mannose-1-phosphate guanyltransferase beta-like protein [Cokeromyces recurvatus]|uniref:mannose-1-phosphate guanyltransferase beta-like protein n=1 Tax=Cokeromyces recurvatus TaxID=90255 RepID=UPI00221F8282|nr:mannose-1-phosphate guanyltransferase beta-like protein [Cokeromyces recurvatus]KAI7908268.1 mannose-1-phosphate guanyltransferase beta-like protein [Cokeromyces recurvatus]
MVKVLILGAGYGTRLQRDLKSSEEYKHLLGVPKALLPLGGRDALITHWIELFKAHGFNIQNDIYIVTNGQCYESFKTWAVNHNIPLDHIANDGTLANEDRLGAVPDIMFGINMFGINQEDVLVVGGDTLFLHDFNLRQFLSTFETHNEHCLVTIYQVNDEQVHKFGIVETNSEGMITSFLEKPEPTATKARSACPCFYLFHKKAIPLIQEFITICKESNAPKEAYDATGKCLAYLYPRFPISTFPISGRIDVGGLDSYIEADKYFNRKQ